MDLLALCVLLWRGEVSILGEMGWQLHMIANSAERKTLCTLPLRELMRFVCMTPESRTY